MPKSNTRKLNDTQLVVPDPNSPASITRSALAMETSA